MSSATQVQRKLVNVIYNGQSLDIHYRQAGEGGIPVILLHPSPLSSSFMLPLVNVMAGNQMTIAWDAPGYGDSDKLPNPGEQLAPYLECFALFMEQLSIDKAIIYGNATGAQMAIEFSKTYPDKVERLILENCALFNEQEQDEFLTYYFPDLSPKSDGSHIELIWKMVNNLFKYFPWYKEEDSAKINAPMPPIEILQATFNDYLKAGVSYADAYKAAIKNEKLSQLAKVTCQTDILIWQDSIIYPYCQRLLAEQKNNNIPENIVLHQVDSGMENRISQLQSLL